MQAPFSKFLSLIKQLGRKRAVTQKVITVLGIETSCDDTSVCVLNSNKEVLSSRRYVNRHIQKQLGGICPAIVADQHRSILDRFVDECLFESNLRLDDLDGVAVSTKPGLVIALRVGADKAIALAKKGRIPLIPVHHMQAHATIASLVADTAFPYLSVLISGAHAIIALTEGPDKFSILLTCMDGSPGECLDKVGREFKLNDSDMVNMHPGAKVEKMALRSSSNGFLRYPVNLQKFDKLSLHFNFTWIKSSYLTMLSKESSVDIPDFCASLQHSVSCYLARKLEVCLQYLNDVKKIPRIKKKVFLSGGVASNEYIRNMLTCTCSQHGYLLVTAPHELCSDNAEMVAWNGLHLLTQSSGRIIHPSQLPFRLDVSAKSPIGMDFSCSLKTHLDSKHKSYAEKISMH